MSKELNKTYDPKDIEDRLYEKWENNGYFHAEVDREEEAIHHRDAATKHHRTVAHGTRP